MGQTTVYFKNFNALRFLAAFAVIVHHFMLTNNRIDTGLFGNFSLSIGKLGVILFFTLSGFLITYLLLVEKDTYGEINIKNFYIRRILRIWPLYYLVVLMALYYLNTSVFFRWVPMSDSVYNDFIIKNILYIFMLPNVGYAFGYNLPYADQVWSIGVEEQFYLFWPILITMFKRPINAIITVFTLYLSIKIGLYFYYSYVESVFSGNFLFFWSNLSFDVMALGSAAALFVYKGSGFKNHFMLRKPAVLSIVLLLSVLLIFSVKFSVLNYEIYAILFCYVLVVLAVKDIKIPILSNSIINYLGKVSFGLYMYHFIAIRIVYIFNYKYPAYSSPFTNFVLVVLVTIFISIISYEAFEKFFIRLKLRYSNIVSGENVNSFNRTSAVPDELSKNIDSNAKLQSR